MLNSEIFTSVSLDPEHVVYTTGFPVQELREYLEFDELWDMHPDEYHTLVMHGKEVKTPRWQQAYGRDYRYSGSRNNAVPISSQLRKFLDWSRANVDERLNGFLLNWYDGAAGHYMGKHRDSRTGLIPDTPIVTISLGEDRIFRFRPWGGKGFKDTLLTDGSALVIPWDTNLAWTHEVPKSKKYTGRRVSVTLRAFA